MTTKTKTNKRTSKSGQHHITVPDDMWEAWLIHKNKKYNGLNAMSMMIRDFVNEGIERELSDKVK